jgi:CheY-like chemotaxis protein
MAKLMRRTLGENIPVTMQFAADLPRVKADPSKIEQVLLNLVVNARDAMPEGGRLRIETARVDLAEAEAAREGLPPGRYAVVSVHDTGVGMAPDVATRVFEPFFTTKERGKGTGLGLAMVYGIVKQAGGSVSVRSAPGEGTIFRVALPATEESLPEQPGSRRLAAAGGTETILLAEDEPAVRAAARRILGHAGYTVIEARGGDDALRLADAHAGKIDVLVTDLVMPGMSGKQLAERICQRRPGIEVVYMSGYVEEGIARHGVLDKDVRFLPKPFTRADLLARVTEALMTSRTRSFA